MTIEVEFSCDRDLALAEHYSHKFKKKFTDQASYWPHLVQAEREAFLAGWRLEMFGEARRQEHYQWEDLDEDQTDWEGTVIGKKRQIIREASGAPKLLIPKIKVTY